MPDITRPRLSIGTRMAAVGILLVAAVLRLAALDRFPPGLHFDEAVYGLQAMEIVHGARPVFFPSYTGREPLYMYVMAILLAGLGQSAWAIRLTSAAIGIVTVALTWVLGSALFNRRVGLIAAGLMAVQYWHLTVSRNGYPNVLIPPLEALAALLLWRGWVHGRRRDWLLGGVFTGLVLYTYLAARFWPILVAVFFIYALLVEPRRWLRNLPGTALAAIAAAAVFAPLGWHFWTHPADFVERANQVVIWRQLQGAELWQALWSNVRQTAAGFLWRGDPRWHYNLPLRAIFQPPIAACFLVGLALCIRRLRDLRYALLVLWLIVLCLPGVLTLELQPAGQRMFGVFPALVLIPAVGLDALVRRLSMCMAVLGIAVILALDAGLTIKDYFFDWVRQPETYAIFNADYAQLAALAKRDVAAGHTVVILSQHAKHPTVVYLAPELADHAIWSEPTIALPLPNRPGGHGPVIYYRLTSYLPDDAPAAVWLDSHDRMSERQVFGPDRQYGSENAQSSQSSQSTQQSLQVVRYAVDVSQTFGTAAGDDRLGDESAAGGYRLADEILVHPVTTTVATRRDKPVTLAVDWVVLRRASGPRGFALHLNDALGTTWAQSDVSGYLADQWQPGDRVRQYFTLELDPTTPPGLYHGEVYLVDADAQPFPVTARPAGSPPAPQLPLVVTRTGARHEKRARVAAAEWSDGGLLLLEHVPVDVAAAVDGAIDVELQWVRSGSLRQDADKVAFWLLPDQSTPRDALPQVARMVAVRDVVDGYPLAEWAERELNRVRYRLAVPAGVSIGQYELWLARPEVHDAQDVRARGIKLGKIRVSAR